MVAPLSAPGYIPGSVLESRHGSLLPSAEARYRVEQWMSADRPCVVRAFSASRESHLDTRECLLMIVRIERAYGFTSSTQDALMDNGTMWSEANMRNIARTAGPH
jgi:hypothetical protein